MLELCTDNRIGGEVRYFLADSEEGLMLVPDEVRKCVVFVCFKGKEGIRLGGTAFFMSVPLGDELKGDIGYLVTAKHVIDRIKAESVDGKVYLRVNVRNKPAALVLTNLEHWHYHPEEENVDVAVLPGALDADIVDYRTIPISMAATEDIIVKEGIGCGDEVFLTGLFANHYGQQRNLPIIRIGNIANMPEEPVQTKDLGLIDAYLVEARSIGGLSGSPVFVQTGGLRRNQLSSGTRFYLLGLMHGHFDLSRLELDDISQDALSELKVNMGIAIVVPVSKILEVINQETLMNEREVIREQRRQERAATPDNAIELPFTKDDFMQDLRKVSQKKSDEEPSET